MKHHPEAYAAAIGESERADAAYQAAKADADLAARVAADADKAAQAAHDAAHAADLASLRAFLVRNVARGNLRWALGAGEEDQRRGRPPSGPFPPNATGAYLYAVAAAALQGRDHAVCVEAGERALVGWAAWQQAEGLDADPCDLATEALERS